MNGMLYQPQGVARLDISHPLTRGLVGFWLPNGGGFVSVVPGVPNAVLTPNSELSYGGRGRRLGSNGNAMSASIAHNTRVKPSQAITVLVDGVMPADASPLPYAFGCENSNDGWGIYNVGGGLGLRAYLRVGSTWVDLVTGAKGGEIGQVGFSFSGSVFQTVVNGAFTNIQSISGTITNSAVGIGINAKNAIGSGGGNGKFSYFAVWNRELSAVEMSSFYANPWQLFLAQDGDDYVAPQSQISYSLNVQLATITTTAGQVGMRASRKMNVAPAVMALATSDVSLKESRQIGVSPAAMSVLGGQVALRTSRRLAVVRATLAITSGQVSMVYAPRLQLGAYTLPVSARAMAISSENIRTSVVRRLRVELAVLAITSGAARTIVARKFPILSTGLLLAVGSASLRIGSGELPRLNAALVSKRRIVVFEGGRRVVTF
jgi:hypothetical protein